MSTDVNEPIEGSSQTRADIVARIVTFLREIGIDTVYGTIAAPSVMPGIAIDERGLVVDIEKLAYPGDVLHEAGHLAVMTPARRAALRGDLPAGLGAEIGAQAWSYAAAIHLELDPGIVFHDAGYHGSASALRDAFAGSGAPGAPLLAWLGLTGDDAYPKMVRWLNETANEP